MIKRTFGLLAVLCALATGVCRAQNTTTFGNIVSQGTPCGSSNCVYYQLPPGTVWVSVAVTGTWAGTLETAVTSAPNANYSNLTTLAWTAVATNTANGTWTVATAGSTYLRVRATTWTGGAGTVATVAMDSTLMQAPLINPVFPGGLTANGLAAPNGGSSSNCWYTNGGFGACGGAGGLADPGGNGLVKRTALNTTAIAGVGDITTLFTGCTGTQPLTSTGGCLANVITSPSGASGYVPLWTGALTQGLSPLDYNVTYPATNLVTFSSATSGLFFNAAAGTGTALYDNVGGTTYPWMHHTSTYGLVAIAGSGSIHLRGYSGQANYDTVVVGGAAPLTLEDTQGSYPLVLDFLPQNGGVANPVTVGFHAQNGTADAQNVAMCFDTAGTTHWTSSSVGCNAGTGTTGDYASLTKTGVLTVAGCSGCGSGGLGDPGANGVVKRTALNTTAAAGYADIVGLFTGGGCTGTNVLAANGSCVTPGSGVTFATDINGTSSSQTVVGLGGVPFSGYTGMPYNTAGTITSRPLQDSGCSTATCAIAQFYSHNAHINAPLKVDRAGYSYDGIPDDFPNGMAYTDQVMDPSSSTFDQRTNRAMYLNGLDGLTTSDATGQIFTWSSLTPPVGQQIGDPVVIGSSNGSGGTSTTITGLGGAPASVTSVQGSAQTIGGVPVTVVTVSAPNVYPTPVSGQSYTVQGTCSGFSGIDSGSGFNTNVLNGSFAVTLGSTNGQSFQFQYTGSSTTFAAVAQSGATCTPTLAAHSFSTAATFTPSTSYAWSSPRTNVNTHVVNGYGEANITYVTGPIYVGTYGTGNNRTHLRLPASCNITPLAGSWDGTTNFGSVFKMGEQASLEAEHVIQGNGCAVIASNDALSGQIYQIQDMTADTATTWYGIFDGMSLYAPALYTSSGFLGSCQGADGSHCDNDVWESYSGSACTVSGVSGATITVTGCTKTYTPPVGAVILAPDAAGFQAPFYVSSVTTSGGYPATITVTSTTGIDNSTTYPQVLSTGTGGVVNILEWGTSISLCCHAWLHDAQWDNNKTGGGGFVLNSNTGGGIGMYDMSLNHGLNCTPMAITDVANIILTASNAYFELNGNDPCPTSYWINGKTNLNINGVTASATGGSTPSVNIEPLVHQLAETAGGKTTTTQANFNHGNVLPMLTMFLDSSLPAGRQNIGSDSHGNVGTLKMGSQFDILQDTFNMGLAASRLQGVASSTCNITSNAISPTDGSCAIGTGTGPINSINVGSLPVNAQPIAMTVYSVGSVLTYSGVNAPTTTSTYTNMLPGYSVNVGGTASTVASGWYSVTNSNCTFTNGSMAVSCTTGSSPLTMYAGQQYINVNSGTWVLTSATTLPTSGGFTLASNWTGSTTTTASIVSTWASTTTSVGTQTAATLWAYPTSPNMKWHQQVYTPTAVTFGTTGNILGGGFTTAAGSAVDFDIDYSNGSCASPIFGGFGCAIVRTGPALSLSTASLLPTGTTGATQTLGDSSTKLATDAFVQNAISGVTGGVPTSAIYSLVEDFLGGLCTGSGAIGQLQWSTVTIVGAPTFSCGTSSWNHPGIQTVTAPATSGDGGSVYLGGSANLAVGANAGWQSEWIASLGATTNAAMRIGFMTYSTASKIPTTGLYFRFDTSLSDTVWMACSTTSSTETCTATAVTPAAGTYYDFNISSATAATISFNVNGGTAVTICASSCTATATPPTTGMVPSANVVTLTAATLAMNLDYFNFYTTGLTR